MTSDKVSCALSLLTNYAKHQGEALSIDDELAFLKKRSDDPHAQGKYLTGDLRYRENTVGETVSSLDPESLTAKAISGMEQVGVPARQLWTYLADAETWLGSDVTNRVNGIYTDFLAKYKATDTDIWDKHYKPQVEALRDSVDIPQEFNQVFKTYFDHHLSGGLVTGLKQPINPLAKVARNVTSNFSKNNPAIALWNVLEGPPKFLAYAVEHGKPMAVFEAMGRYLKESGGNPLYKIPELAEKGVYGTKTDGFNLIDITEVPLRSIAYYLGESISPGQGAHALEKIAFIYRFGNEPLVFLDATGSDSMALMRYGLASTKMYMRLLNKTVQGDPKALAALGAFSLMTAIQTGGASAVPAPVYTSLSDEQKQALADMDNASGMNLTRHFLGQDYAEVFQPVSIPALGVGYAIATQDIKGGVQNISEGTGALVRGDLVGSSTKYLQSIMALGQFARIPGVNLTSKRLIDEIVKTLRDEESPEDIIERSGEALKVLNEPEFQ